MAPIDLEEPTPADGDWKRSLVMTKDKKGNDRISPVIANAVTILKYDEAWTGVLALNTFRGAVVTTETPPWDANEAPADARPGEWTDADTVRACNWLVRHYGLSLSVSAVEQAIPVVAEHRIVHPVADWLATLQWDGTPRLDRLFVEYFGAEDTAYVRGVGARFMIGAVARVKNPGCKVDCTPVLEGPQGIGKSTGVRRLAGDDWFSDTPFAMGDKDGYQGLRGKWVLELGELHALGRSDLNRAKNFLTATFDSYRPSYGRRTRDFPRQCVFVGTTNASEYLRDETGNRRFWPVRCSRVDLEAIARDRDQLWAEAMVRYARREPWHVNTSEFARACEAEQEDRFVADAWEAPIAEWVACKGHPERRTLGVTTGEVLEGALGIPKERWAKAEQDRAASVLRRLGWERGKLTRARKAEGGDGERQRRWKPKTLVTLVTLVTGDSERHQANENAELVTDPVTTPVTRESGSQTPMSPASPAYLRTYERDEWGVRSPIRINETRGDAGDVVTTPLEATRRGAAE